MTRRDRSGDDPPPWFDPAGLPDSAHLGDGVRIFAHIVQIGKDVSIGDHSVIVGDEIRIGDDVSIASGCEIRAASVSIGARSEIHAQTQILVADEFRTGDAARISRDVKITCRTFCAGHLLYMGDGATVGYGGTLSSTSSVRIGNRVTIGQHTILNANFPIEVGDDVGTGSYLAIWTHGYHFGHGPLDGSQVAYAPVRIGRNVWLGFHVTVLPGVSIGDNSIVAAGSVVTRDLPPDVLAGGVPAKVRKPLDRRVVAGREAHAALAHVLRAWRTELEWKGCAVETVRDDEACVELVVDFAEGSDRARVLLLGDGEPVPSPGAGESLVIVSIDERAGLEAPDAGSTTFFVLRKGELRGHSSPIVEDLRDQLRRHAMPCGDKYCFSSIEPKAFARLRRASSAKRSAP